MNNNVSTYNLDPTAGNPLEMILEPMILVPLLDQVQETSLLGCGCGRTDGCGSGGSCLCGSDNGCGG